MDSRKTIKVSNRHFFLVVCGEYAISTGIALNSFEQENFFFRNLRLMYIPLGTKKGCIEILFDTAPQIVIELIFQSLYQNFLAVLDVQTFLHAVEFLTCEVVNSTVDGRCCVVFDSFNTGWS